MNVILKEPLTYIKGVGAVKAELLASELGIRNVGDLLNYYPFRYEDRSSFSKIKDISEATQHIQIKGKITQIKELGAQHSLRLSAIFTDGENSIELVWFKSVAYLKKVLQVNKEIVVFGKPSFFKGIANFAHPEIEDAAQVMMGSPLHGIYSSTEMLRKRKVESKVFRQAIQAIFESTELHIPEFFPKWIMDAMQFPSRFDTLKNIHLPQNEMDLQSAQRRLKFEELFFLQFPFVRQKLTRKKTIRGSLFNGAPTILKQFYDNHLPFELTGAQKRVLGEIKKDLQSGEQMNRLLQGDVGSGKTMVAFMCVLMAIDSGFQTALMAPTEILATQHFIGLNEYASKVGVRIVLLTGSTTKKQKQEIARLLTLGEIHLLIGTHALIEDYVTFKNLGLVIIDEQHRFGVAQRAKLQAKNSTVPHVLVMTATPIPRTLAMSVYGDLDQSVIDEMPGGRKPIKTVHRYGFARQKVWEFIRNEVDKGRQAYIVYPLIEESKTMPYKDLQNGYDELLTYFKRPRYQVDMIHGQMKAQDKEAAMLRFKDNVCHILVATTVIEVGINVPNATIMVIESSEKFGLSQLHQLRGRVGRGGEQSYCILMSNKQLNESAKTRIQAMVNTNSGFELSEIDMKLRGFGDIAGTRQSGLDQLKLASLVADEALVKMAQQTLVELFNQDPNLELPHHQSLKSYWLAKQGNKEWSLIA